MFALRLLLIALLIVSVPAASFAQDDAARAIELIARGNKAFDAGDFRAALESYREAYAVTTDPRVLYRIGVTYENLANYQRAREHLEMYLLAEPNSKYAGRVKSKIENLRKLEATLQSAVQIESEPPGADIWVDTVIGKPSGVTPVRIPLGPGEHNVLIRKAGFEDVHDTFEVGSGETVQKTYDLGAGAPVATQETPTQTAATITTGPTDKPPEQDPTIFAGEPSHARIGPSTGISVLSWISIAAGWTLIVTASILSAGVAYYWEPGALGGTFVLGAGLVALGGYFLWFRDYSKHLPPATAAGLGGIAPQRIVGIGVRF